MPMSPRPVTDERDGLMVFLNQQRDGIRAAIHGLSEEQARARSTPTSELSIAALLKHLAAVERDWANTARGAAKPFDMANVTATWALQPDDTVEHLLADYARAQRETDELFATLDLDAPVTAPQAPWFPPGLTWSVRWVLLHLIQETARHAGHADILREAIDGKTMYELIVAAGL